MSRAYYNEFDKNAAAWLRELITAGLIAPGDVDERSIIDVFPSDLRGYTQCHFFAGIGVWSHALRKSGFSDDRSVWTGSCPCQPFSAAGDGLAFADERHLWPAFHHLIKECRPELVFGEQVASKDADAWVDLVQTDLEALDYAFGAVPFPAAGIGAPHLRDRLYWVADAESNRHERTGEFCESSRGHGAAYGGAIVGLAHPCCEGPQEQRREWDKPQGLAENFFFGGLVDDQLQQRPTGQSRSGPEHEALGRIESAATPSGLCGNRGLADSAGRLDERGIARPDQRPMAGSNGTMQTEHGSAGPTNGHWRDADWLYCRDGKWRPVEPGTFPLVDGTAKGMVRGSNHGLPINAESTGEGRVMRLRGYGNAINAIQAQIFIESFMEISQ